MSLSSSSISEGAFHLSKLAGQTGQFVNGMYRLKNKFNPCPSIFFKIARNIFGVIMFSNFVAPSLQNDSFDVQTGRSGQPVLTNGKHPGAAY